jgi:hypothetical protein
MEDFYNDQLMDSEYQDYLYQRKQTLLVHQQYEDYMNEQEAYDLMAKEEYEAMKDLVHFEY